MCGGPARIGSGDGKSSRVHSRQPSRSSSSPVDVYRQAYEAPSKPRNGSCSSDRSLDELLLLGMKLYAGLPQWPFRDALASRQSSHGRPPVSPSNNSLPIHDDTGSLSTARPFREKRPQPLSIPFTLLRRIRAPVLHFAIPEYYQAADGFSTASSPTNILHKIHDTMRSPQVDDEADARNVHARAKSTGDE
ncbi:hypothetical protein LTR35_017511 [Friedmanniomyces endolithicus]|uniref:Uncharacterized protein n=1 Tax=Friedmanniomyces endolithicus TaxID=329885 RepID=A0AAN6IZL8_9PEZI|nr:hypothetical protein LTR35_017511 [Friedmanniomyces endolithicus]KAK0270451.1 hypothetical protein LTS00_016954 [Friedmanniomyces endolithicus]KAK0303327.1 hypothetical protein LTR82_017591 [Friedmanniomyces endolithicus]KAK0972583.1 hypothetical protein LTR54_017533 [Friedmanniomyces endolithicus]